MIESTHKRWWGWTIVGLIAFVLMVVPYLLPLGGPPTVAPAALADTNGVFVNVDGELLYMVHAPGGDREAVLLIHGFGGATVTWEETIPDLAQAGHDVYAIDLAGFGLSQKGWELDYHHAAQARRVIGFMDQLGLDRATIVGHSMGGNVAAHIALAYPDRISRLVLVDAAILSSDRGRLAVPDFLLDVPFVRRWAQWGLRRGIEPLFVDLLTDAAYQDDAISADLVAAYRRVVHTPEWDAGLLGIFRDGDGNDLPAPVSQIQAPTLIVWGAEDSWVTMMTPENETTG